MQGGVWKGLMVKKKVEFHYKNRGPNPASVGKKPCSFWRVGRNIGPHRDPGIPARGPPSANGEGRAIFR